MRTFLQTFFCSVAGLIASGAATLGDQIAPLGSGANAMSSPDYRATVLLGAAVRNESGEKLGKVVDLIVNLDSRAVPYAIVEHGNTLGIGGTRIAVPLAAFKTANDRTHLVLPATRDQFEKSAATPTGGWMSVVGEDWVKSVDRFYGDPTGQLQSRYERQEVSAPAPPPQLVRNAEPEVKAPNGQPAQGTADPELKHRVVTPTDEFIMSKINAVVNQTLGPSASEVQVTLKNGIVTLKGRIASDAQKKLLENRIKVLAGVEQVQNSLSIANLY